MLKPQSSVGYHLLVVNDFTLSSYCTYANSQVILRIMAGSSYSLILEDEAPFSPCAVAKLRVDIGRTDSEELSV